MVRWMQNFRKVEVDIIYFFNVPANNFLDMPMCKEHFKLKKNIICHC